MNRRGFLAGILAAGAAPAIIRTAGLLMPIRQIITPTFPLVQYGETVTINWLDPREMMIYGGGRGGGKSFELNWRQIAETIDFKEARFPLDMRLDRKWWAL